TSSLSSTPVELKRGVNHFKNVERFTSILIPGRKDRYGYFTVTTRHSQWAQKRKAVHDVIGIYHHRGIGTFDSARWWCAHSLRGCRTARSAHLARGTFHHPGAFRRALWA